MLNPQHEEHIDELIDTLASTMKITARRLANSGALNLESFNPVFYALAKIVVTAAMHEHADDYAPLDAKQKRMVKNLSKF